MKVSGEVLIPYKGHCGLPWLCPGSARAHWAFSLWPRQSSVPRWGGRSPRSAQLTSPEHTKTFRGFLFSPVSQSSVKCHFMLIHCEIKSNRTDFWLEDIHTYTHTYILTHSQVYSRSSFSTWYTRYFPLKIYFAFLNIFSILHYRLQWYPTMRTAGSGFLQHVPGVVKPDVRRTQK